MTKSLDTFAEFGKQHGTPLLCPICDVERMFLLNHLEVIHDISLLDLSRQLDTGKTKEALVKFAKEHPEDFAIAVQSL